MAKPAQSDQTLRTILTAITHEYAALARMRFTIAGLYLAATGFLASTWFAGLGDGNRHLHVDVGWPISINSQD